MTSRHVTYDLYTHLITHQIIAYLYFSIPQLFIHRFTVIWYHPQKCIHDHRYQYPIIHQCVPGTISLIYNEHHTDLLSCSNSRMLWFNHRLFGDKSPPAICLRSVMNISSTSGMFKLSKLFRNHNSCMDHVSTWLVVDVIVDRLYMGCTCRHDDVCGCVWVGVYSVVKWCRRDVRMSCDDVGRCGTWAL